MAGQRNMTHRRDSLRATGELVDFTTYNVICPDCNIRAWDDAGPLDGFISITKCGCATQKRLDSERQVGILSWKDQRHWRGKRTR